LRISVGELKQAITRLNKRGREEVHAHLIWLQHNSPAWKREAARRIRKMQAGKGVTKEELEAGLRAS